MCEEFLKEKNQHTCLLELYKCNGMHHEALKLLHKLVEDSNSDNPPAELIPKFKPEQIIDYLKVSLTVLIVITCCIWLDITCMYNLGKTI